MSPPSRPLPERFDRIAGPLPEPGAVPAADASPYETVQPVREGFVDRDGVKIWYAVWGDSGPWIAFAPPLQIVHSQMLKGTVPYLSRHFRVITTDGRGNGRSDRPLGQDAYSFDHFYADFVAVLDAVGAERVALVGISAGAMTVLRLAAEQPQRVTHVVTAGGFADSLPSDEKLAQRLKMEGELLRNDWPAYVDWFMGTIFNEPHSTKPYEDGVHYGWATNAEWLNWCRNAWMGNDVRELARRVSCPTLVIHGDEDRRVPYAKGQAHPRAGAGLEDAHHRRWRPCHGGTRPGGLQPCAARLRRRRAAPAHLGARHEAPTPRAVHLQPDRPRPRAARPGHRARAAPAAAGSGDRLVHRRPGRALPRARRRTPAPDHPAPGQREPPLRAGGRRG